ncbi:hypothetical protein NBRC110019_25030 [Neptunitalea chrysea]|uniref:Sugar transporter n=1 Tax=Neptunitalea chrysea TaxID=1647581 RepID=A0A9W6B7V0_9FLAO|nr:hypothetical protein [Neptunitalea chrysea]GLB53462.1 hypothetical protein NBRC110019_25030 [Neptunitalea chrysea]
MSPTAVKPPVWFMIVAILAIIWNLMGVLAFVGDTFVTPEVIDQMPELDQKIRRMYPEWSAIVFGIATISAAIASLGLTLRKSWSHYLFLISFIAVLVQSYYTFVVIDFISLKGFGMDTIMSLAIVFIGAFLLWFSYIAAKKRWII